MPHIAVVIVADASEADRPAAERFVRAMQSIGTQAGDCQVVIAATASDPSLAQDALAALPARTELIEMPAAPLDEAVAEAVRRTDAPILAFSDGRNVWKPNKLASQSAAFTRPGLDFCGHREDCESDGIAEIVEHPAEAKWPALLRALRRPAWNFSTALIRRSAFDRLGGLREGADAWHDFLVRGVREGIRQILLEVPMARVDSVEAPWPDPLPELAPASGSSANIRAHIDALSIDELLGRAPADTGAGKCVRAGLYELYDWLDACHAIAQSVDGPLGSYWHAIMHRREGDYDNSKYWFHRVGAHPVFARLYDRATAILRQAVGKPAAELRRDLELTQGWDPYRFVDFCSVCTAKKAVGSTADTAKRLQMAEFDLLFAHTVATATG